MLRWLRGLNRLRLAARRPVEMSGRRERVPELKFAPVEVEPAAAPITPAPRTKRRRSHRSDGGIELRSKGS